MICQSYDWFEFIGLLGLLGLLGFGLLRLLGLGLWIIRVVGFLVCYGYYVS